jgi:hypothetical protein
MSVAAKKKKEQEWHSFLDPGIAEAVKLLNKFGVETFESCQGGKGHCFPEPTVRFHGGKSEGLRALAITLQHGLNTSELRRYYTVIDGEPVGPYWEITFAPKRKG